MTRIVQAQEKHLDMLELKSVFEKDARANGRAHLLDGCPAYTVLNSKGKPVAILGGTFVNDGTIEVFGLLSDEMNTCGPSLHKEVKKLCDAAFTRFNVHRLQINVRADFLAGQRWVEHFGFKVEGLMEKFGADKEDYVLYGKVI